MELTIKQIANLINGEVIGDETIKVNTLAKIEEAQEGSIAFLSNPKYEIVYENEFIRNLRKMLKGLGKRYPAQRK